MTSEFDAIIELLDGIQPPKTWCQIFEEDNGWSIFPVHISENRYKVMFLVEDAPIKEFSGKRVELKQANKILGWIIING
jgi:hypothetical protein